MADVVTQAIESLDLEYPQLSPADRRALAKARKKLGRQITRRLAPRLPKT